MRSSSWACDGSALSRIAAVRDGRADRARRLGCVPRAIHTSSAEAAMSPYHEICRQFYDNRLLFGNPSDPGIVAVEVVPPGEVEIFRRSGDTLTRERRPLKLFALLAEPGMLNGMGAPYKGEPPAGTFRLRWLATFDRIDALE